MDRVARRGLLARALDALKGADTSEIVNTFVAVEGGPLERKTNFRKISQGRKIERWTLWGFSTSILSQNIKKLKEGIIFIFDKKSHNAEKI